MALRDMKNESEFKGNFNNAKTKYGVYTNYGKEAFALKNYFNGEAFANENFAMIKSINNNILNIVPLSLFSLFPLFGSFPLFWPFPLLPLVLPILVFACPSLNSLLSFSILHPGLSPIFLALLSSLIVSLKSEVPVFFK